MKKGEYSHRVDYICATAQYAFCSLLLNLIALVDPAPSINYSCSFTDNTMTVKALAQALASQDCVLILRLSLVHVNSTNDTVGPRKSADARGDQYWALIPPARSDSTAEYAYGGSEAV
jgi:hypothetical protein